ncbi:MAG: methyltransferase domain-containing protein [Pseudohongiellaceae bacterium]
MSGQSKFQIRRKLLKALPEANPPQQELAEWFASALGQRALESERLLLAPVLERLFGYHILQIGCSEHHSLISDSPVGHKIIFAPRFYPGVRQAVASNEELPLPSDSMDAVLIHHALEFGDSSHKLLREAARVLRPGGRLMVLGFNPVSAWGIRKLFSRHTEVPWRARFIANHRVTDWLRLLDHYVESTAFAGHYLPLNYAGLLKRADNWERFGIKLNLPFGGIYFVLSTKQVAPLTPVVPRWRPLRTPATALPATENVRARIH